jgi:hypothetical protein
MSSVLPCNTTTMRVPVANTNKCRDIIQEIFNDEAIITITANYASCNNCHHVEMTIMSNLPVDEHNRCIQLAMLSIKEKEREHRTRREIDDVEKEQIDVNIGSLLDEMELVPKRLFEEEQSPQPPKPVAVAKRRSPRGFKSLLNRRVLPPDHQTDKPISVFGLGIAFPLPIIQTNSADNPVSPFSSSLRDMLKENGELTKSVELPNSGYTTAVESPPSSDTETKSIDGKRTTTKPKVLIKPKWLSATSVEESVLEEYRKELTNAFVPNEINIETKKNERSGANKKQYYYVNVRSNVSSATQHDDFVLVAMKKLGLDTERYIKTAVFHVKEKERERKEREREIRKK